MIKRINTFCTIFILLIMGAIASRAQESAPRLVKVKERRVILAASKQRILPNLILDKSGQIQGLVVKSAGQRSQLFLETLGTRQQILIDEFSTKSKNHALRLSGGGRYVCYNVFDADRTVSFKIYDFQAGELIHIKRPDGNVGYPDVNTKSGKILYQLENRGQMAKIYLANKNGGNPQLIAEGRGARWSPDGKWFRLLHDHNKETIMSLKGGRVLSRDKSHDKRELPISVQLPPRKIEFFNAEGESQFNIVEFTKPSYIVWSPKSDKIILRDEKERKLYLLSFSVVDNSLQLKRIEESLSDKPGGEYFIHPVWSPDGKKLIFEKVKDSHYGFENIDVVLYDIESKRLESITNTPNIFEKVVSWKADGSILIKKENKKSEALRLEKIILK